jgi:hypothetical protein
MNSKARMNGFIRLPSMYDGKNVLSFDLTPLAGDGRHPPNHFISHQVMA